MSDWERRQDRRTKAAAAVIEQEFSHLHLVMPEHRIKSLANLAAAALEREGLLRNRSRIKIDHA